MLEEFTATPDGLDFLNARDGGAKKYDNVIFFEHATLAVSPVINALELGRFFAGSAAQIDVIAHSRGGLIVRWWLEGVRKSLSSRRPRRCASSLSVRRCTGHRSRLPTSSRTP